MLIYRPIRAKTMILRSEYIALLFLYLTLLLSRRAKQKDIKMFEPKPFSQSTSFPTNAVASNQLDSAELIVFPRSEAISKKLEITGSEFDQIRSLTQVREDHMHLNGSMATYVPGVLNVTENGLILSAGLKSRLIAESKAYVKYFNGKSSKSKFHDRPDGATVFSLTEGSHAGGWIYVSNSEVGNGGVGALTFDSEGEVVKYEMILKGTHRNCSGGKTYWNTYITCEENKRIGQVYEIDPFASRESSVPPKPTVLGLDGGRFEAFAYDARDRLNPTFYVTTDHKKGSLRKFTPDKTVVSAAETSGDYTKMLHVMGNMEFLILKPKSGRENDKSGTFEWTTSKATADKNAKAFYRNSEGIDIRNGILYFTTKASKSLFILDLDRKKYTRTSTERGSFDGQPDQVARILADDPSRDMLYFCEEASSSNGIHARDTEGNFFTVLTSAKKSETTGCSMFHFDQDPYAAHNRLYNHGKTQRDKLEKLRLDRTEEEIAVEIEQRGDVWTENQANEASSRLYYRSIKQQEAGRQRREAIEKKHAPREPTPSRKIKLEDANKIYERGMLHKVQMEIKREQRSLSKDYVSPMLDPLVTDHTKPKKKMLADKTSSDSRIRSRSRIRSMSTNGRSVSRSQSHTVTQRSQSVQRQPPTKPKFHPAPIKPMERRSRSSTPMKRVPNTRTRSPTPARTRYYQD